MQRFKSLFTAIDMSEGTPWRKIALFAIPLLIGNLFQQMYSTVDAIMLGRFIGDHALAAVGASMPVFFLIFVLILGLAMGAGIMVSQYFGAKKREELSYTIGNGITLITIISLILMITGPFLTRPLLTLLGTPAEIMDDSVLYMNILLLGVLPIAFYNILSGILRSLGDSFSPLIFLIIACILNIIFNFFLIPPFGVAGAAAGTVLAQAISSVLCFKRISNMRNVFDLGKSYLVLKKEYVSQILKLGVPSGASHVVIALSFMFVQPLVNSFGSMIIATNMILMRIDSLVMMPIFSFGGAMSVFAGQNVGAGKMDRVSKGTKQGALMAVGTTLVLVMVIVFLGRFIAGVFTQTQEIIDLTAIWLRLLAIGFIPFSLSNVLWGTIRGAGDAISPLWGAAINSVFIRLPAAFILVEIIGEPVALIYSTLLAWTGTTLISIIVYKMGRWRTKGIIRYSPKIAEDVKGSEEIDDLNVDNEKTTQ